MKPEVGNGLFCTKVYTVNTLQGKAIEMRSDELKGPKPLYLL